MRMELHFFLCQLQTESGDFVFVVGHSLFKTHLSMASSWWHFNGCIPTLFLMVALEGRDILLGLSLARTISSSLIVQAVTHSIVLNGIIYMGVNLILQSVS